MLATLCGLIAAASFAEEPPAVNIVVANTVNRSPLVKPVHHKQAHKHIVHAHKVFRQLPPPTGSDAK
ncbi:hypothetical protein [Vogesella oryzae]|uniref:hypothetical protein n=1 Tax=Vogesella oryzae TaxID=1735285 RepID=UPI0015832549|nr:hypothetical protein [Vogesella oryzae]